MNSKQPDLFARAAWLVIAAAALLLPVQPALAQAPAAAAPDELVKSVANDVIKSIRDDPELQAGNRKRVAEVIETKLLPHFDFTRMTALAMGRNWSRATPEQQKALTDEFRTLLVRTYSGALNNYRNQQIDVRPTRANPGDSEVVVRTQVVQPGAQPVSIDYAMARTPQGWKVHDVIVGGVSLVTNYRDEFGTTVREAGVEGLIKVLAQKNRSDHRA